ncbi:MAG: hypothetical protein AB1638_04300 [Nitrospirota bacterium]
MKTISSIKWTDKSIEHVARHGIKPNEVEEVCFNDHDASFIRSGRENLHYVFGKTYSGRLLFVVVRFVRHGEIRVTNAVISMATWNTNLSFRAWPGIQYFFWIPAFAGMTECILTYGRVSITARDMNTWEKNYFKKRGK